MPRIIIAVVAAIVIVAVLLILWPFVSPVFTHTSTKTITQQQTVPFQVETKQDAGLPSGQRVTDQTGKTGTKQVTFKVTLKHGKETGRKVVSEKVTAAPRSEVDRVGTAAPSSSLDATSTPVAGRDTLWETLVLLALIAGARLYGRSARELYRAAAGRE